MKKEIIKGSLCLLVFHYLATIAVLIMNLVFHITIHAENILELVVLDFSVSAAVVIIMVGNYYELIMEDLKKIKEKWKNSFIKEFLKKVIIAFLLMYAVKYVSAIVVQVLSMLLGLESTTVENQRLIEELLASAPAMMIISSCLFAPVTEELLFRGALGKVIKNKWVFIAVSGLTFGLMHVTGSMLLIFEIIAIGLIISLTLNRKDLSKESKMILSVTLITVILILCGGIYYFQYGNLIAKILSLDLTEVVGSIVYILMGCFLAYVYRQEENILIPIGVHAFNNILSMILLLFTI